VFGFYGKLNEYYVYGPGYWDFDISLLKNVRISDRFRIQFRAEAFNHVNSLVGDNKSLQAFRPNLRNRRRHESTARPRSPE
jgi:hypothetical protein